MFTGDHKYFCSDEIPPETFYAAYVLNGSAVGVSSIDVSPIKVELVDSL
ncbi:hypothetical protein PLUTE_a6021 [Pseudoalteromonas luteoviolacea DSM 6061]|nr:hypothetical protein [Pseudoalteromonas luteoviolacea DSM 6061]